MKTIRKVFAFGAALLAAVTAFGQYTVLVDETNRVIFPTNLFVDSITSTQFVGNGALITNLNASRLASGTAPTNVLPGALSTLSTWNGGGLLTNTFFPVTYFWQNTNQVSALASNITIPTGARSFLVECVGAGGPGGSGRRGAAGSLRTGGGGGGGGAYSSRWVPVSTLWSTTLRITIPALGLGGPGPTTDDSDGTNGTAAAASTIVYVGGSSLASNYICRAVFGSAGAAGNATGAAAGGTATTSGDFVGTAGGASSGTGGVGTSGTAGSGKGSRGGGAGGGITTGDAPAAGGAGAVGGVHSALATSGGAINGAAVGLYSALTTVPHPSYLYGASGFPGASGSGGATNVASANGADGEFPGSGGGGSGATLNGSAPGRGGNGGPGAVWITFY